MTRSRAGRGLVTAVVFLMACDTSEGGSAREVDSGAPGDASHESSQGPGPGPIGPDASTHGQEGGAPNDASYEADASDETSEETDAPTGTDASTHWLEAGTPADASADATQSNDVADDGSSEAGSPMSDGSPPNGLICGCPGGFKMCNGNCVSTDDPSYGCATGCSACSGDNATFACSSGACVIGACAQGYADCDGIVSNGCETDLRLPSNCGRCAKSCPAAGLCSPAGCMTQCTPPLTNCGGGCVDLTTDPANCGGCGYSCLALGGANWISACVAGSCQVDTACDTGYTLCPDGSCVDINVDPNNCGACGATCARGCQNGQCRGPSCGAGFTDCGGTCVDDRSATLRLVR